MIKIAYSPIYKYELPEGHRFPMEKYELLPEQLLYEGSIDSAQLFQPDRLHDDEILLTHSLPYLRKLNLLKLSDKEVRSIGFPVSQQLIERGKYISGGTYQCALYAMKYGVSLNVAGGTHHSFRDHGEGFCIFNDFAIASNLLLTNHPEIRQILILDLDVHQGNGTAKIFEGDQRVFTCSFHGAKNYPVRKEKSDLDVAFADGTTDDVYLNKLYEVLPGLLRRIEPDLIFYLSGADVLASDKLGRLSLSKEGAKMRDKFVFECCKTNGIPVAVSMGGGYSQRIGDIVDAHANTFRMANEVYDEY